MKRYFQKFRDDRFALTTLQNPDLEVRTHAQLVQAAQQEREWQATARANRCNPTPAPPDAPASIPVSELPADLELPEESPEEFPEELSEEELPEAELPESVASSAPAPDSTKPDSTKDEAQQILDSLVAGVLTAGSSPRSSQSLSLRDAELPARTPPKPGPKNKKRPKTKSRLKSNAHQYPALARALASQLATANSGGTAARDDQPGGNQLVEQDEDDGPTPLERHTRKCAICKHPGREFIEEAFLQWRSPDTIKRLWDLHSRATIYHHAHAFNLFALRTRNLQLCLGNIIEDADNQGFTATHILHAIRFLAHVNEDGRWTHPIHKSEVTYSVNHLPAAPGLPVGQVRLSTHPNAPPTDELSEPKLIATQLLNIVPTH